ncbi:MAG: site-specific integrase [Ignavibacteriaceae bacterium]|nr:site-specific integrase [Ignavibacteriaceae bacterium]
MNTAKKLVYLRERKDVSKPDSAISLFLDYKDGSRKRIREILKGLILSPSNKQIHKEIRAKAELMRVQKERELLQGEFDIQIRQKNILFTPYMSDLAETKPNNKRNFFGAAKHLEKHSPGIRIQNITAEYLDVFRKHLQKEGLKENTIKTYLSKIRVTLRTAPREKIIFKNPAEGFKVGKYEPKTIFLTKEEVKTLLRTPCISEKVKGIFLFQLLTALRISDVRKLTRGDIKGDRITFRQSKTKGLHEIIISPQIASLLGIEKGIIPIDKKKPLFDVPSLSYLNKILKLWGKAAGLSKIVTTHVARHTAATHLLRTGSDIKTVSGTLGHKDLSSTLVYIHAIDKEREKAANKLGELISI